MELEKDIRFLAGGGQPGAPVIRVLAILRSTMEREKILAALNPLPGIQVETILRPLELNRQVVHAMMPSVLLVEVDLADPADIDLIREMKTGIYGVRIPVVALADRTTDLAAVRAIRAGADDVLLKPIDQAEAREVFARVTVVDTANASSLLGKVVVFLHLTGGAGATTLAVNTAFLLSSAVNPTEACLLDLDIQYGNAGDLLDLPAGGSIETLVEDPSRLDSEMLENMMAKHESGLRVLTAPRIPLPLGLLNAAAVSALMQTAKRRFRYVVVDLPVALAPWTDQVLREANIVYVVCPPNVSSVHRLAHLLRLLRQEELINLPLKIVVNRHQFPRKAGEISVDQFGDAIGQQVDHLIPNDYSLISLSHNQGHAAVQMKPNSKFTQQLRAMLGEDLGIKNLQRKPRNFFSFLGF
jgi:pilus assembly protein CpaE